MPLKTQAVAPLETIYEESGSFISSSADITHRHNHDRPMNETINGLISARSIPTVSFQRRRIIENQSKPPIEVRFRDGSKRYIHPSASSDTTMMNRRKFLDSSHNGLSSNTQTNNPNKRTLQSKIPLVITIITAEDLNQAGITPTISSSSDDSETQAYTSGQSKTLTNHMKNMQDINQDPLETLSVISSQSSSQTIVNSSVFNPRSPVNHTEYLQSQKQNPMTHSQTTSSQTSLSSTNQTVFNLTRIPPIQNTKVFTQFVKAPSMNDDTSKNLPTKTYTKNNTKETVNRNLLNNKNVLTGSGSRSAFRPFHKLVGLNGQSTSNKSQIPTKMNGKFNDLAQHRNKTVSFFQLSRKERTPLNSSDLSNDSAQKQSTNTRSLASKRLYDTVVLRKTVADVAANQSNRQISFMQMNSSANKKDSYPVHPSNTNTTDKTPYSVPNINNVSQNPEQAVPSTADNQTKWLNVASNSIRDIAEISTKYSAVPIRITLPIMTPTHNQKLIAKHDVALENRLLNAGLSPETVALYERILNIAEDPQLSVTSPANVLTE